MTDNFNELADRVEQLTGPDRYIDAEIAGAFSLSDSPNYTYSLDAARTLLPQHHPWSLSSDPEAGFANGGYAGAGVFQKDGNDVFHAESITPALALLAAILRAKAVG